MDFSKFLKKKVKLTRPNGTFVIGLLKEVTDTHFRVFSDLNEEHFEPIATTSIREAW